ncbi:MAG: hypothetical protein HYY98_14545 [Burkholderiales bacterium]|nr:hypothetical protein [Burkholderiales bacterium]
MPAFQLQLPELAASDAANDCSPAVVPLAAVVVAHPVMDGEGCTGNEKRKGRPAVHATGAARKAAYRAAKARVDYTDAPYIIDKLRETAAQLDCSVNELLQSMVRFAETNRNWKQVGLYGKRSGGVLQ